MFAQAVTNVEDVLRKEACCTAELADIEQTRRLLVLVSVDGVVDERPSGVMA